jgi:hypothetical protein
MLPVCWSEGERLHNFIIKYSQATYLWFGTFLGGWYRFGGASFYQIKGFIVPTLLPTMTRLGR